MFAIRIFWLAFVICAVSAPLAGAQVIERPPRVYRGLFGAGASDPNRTRHSLMFIGNTFFGVDNNLVPTGGETSSIGTPAAGEPGYAGFGGLQLQYTSVKGARTIEFDTRGFMNTYSGLDLNRVFGGEVSGRTATPLGRRVTRTAYERYSDSPMFAPNTTSPRSPLDGPFQPATTPLADTTSYLVRRSKSADGGVTFERRMTPSATLVLGGTHGNNRYDDGIGDFNSWGGMLNHRQAFGRRSAVVGGYTYTSTESRGGPDSPERPFENHNVMVSTSTIQRLGPTRQLSMSIGAGLNFVNTLSSLTSEPLSYRTPSGQASIRYDFARTWNVAAEYGRIVSVIEGVTLDTFITDGVSVRAGGQFLNRGDLAVSVNWASGEAGPTGAGTYESYTGILQLQFAVNRWIDTMVSSTFYTYKLDGVTMIVEGLSSQFDRHAIRAGLVFRLPLYGQYVTTRPGAGR